MNRPTVALLLVAGAFLVAACSGGDNSSADSGGPTESTSASSNSSDSPSQSAAADPCTLLTAKKASKIVGGPVAKAESGDMAGMPQCRWPAKGGTGWVQASSVDASVWSRSMPEFLEELERSGLVTDKAKLEKLREGAEVVESGEDLEPAAACSMFSQMLQLQGKPRGSSSVVAVLPGPDDAKSVSTQICNKGWYTSVALIDPDGLTAPFPSAVVERAARRIHRKATA